MIDLWTKPWTRNVAILCMRDLDQFDQGKPIDPIRTPILHRLQVTAPHQTLSSGGQVARFAYEQCAKTFYRLDVTGQHSADVKPQVPKPCEECGNAPNDCTCGRCGICMHTYAACDCAETGRR